MIPEKKAKDILLTYEGYNNKILEYKWKLENQKYFSITRPMASYILKTHEEVPKVARKHITLTDSFAETLMKDKMLVKLPKQIWCEKLLTKSEKAYHIWGRLTEVAPLSDFWLPKTAIIPEEKVYEGEIDWSKYAVRPPLSHQEPAIRRLLANDKYLLADDMGLAKTGSAVMAALESGAKKVLIICPASLKINWQREIEIYTRRRTLIVEGTKWGSTFDFYIINYDILKNYHSLKAGTNSLIERENFDLVIADEAHFLSKNTAARTKLTLDILDKIPKVWLLTGTPMTSRPMDYYNLLKSVGAIVTENWQHYVKRYCGGYQFTINQGGEKKKIWNTKGATNLDELNELNRNKVLRRLKTEVTDLPGKIVSQIPLEMQNSALYDLEIEQFMTIAKHEREDSNLSITINRLMAVRQIIAAEKVPYTCEIVDKFIEADKKVIIFTNFSSVVDELKGIYGKKAVVVDGRMNKNKRQLSVDEFQNNPKVKVFIGNIIAAGAGLNLTAAEAVVMNDLSFVPAHHLQAEDRANRIGQTKSVNIYYPIFENTIEIIIYNIIQNKNKVINKVMGDDEFEMASVGKELMKNIL